MVFDILVVLLAGAGIVFLIRLAFGLLLMPLRGHGCRVCVTVSAQGETADLERVIRGAVWLAGEGTVDLILIDKGLDECARKAAEKLAEHGKYPLYSVKEIQDHIGDIL